MEIKKLFAFLKRDFHNAVSYKLSFIMGFIGIFFSVFTFFFISKLIGVSASPYLASYGGDYFSFALIGIAFTGFMGLGMYSFSSIIRSGQTTGTLEYLMSTPTKISTILIGSSLWSFIFQSINVIVYIAVGVYLGVDISKANFFGAVVVLILAIIAFSGLGIISAGCILIFKKGDPVNWIFTSFSGLVGGTLYPITVLPEWLQKIAYFLPITYALRAMRYALLQGYSFSALSKDILILIIFCIILIPLGIWVFKIALNKSKKDGGLGKY